MNKTKFFIVFIVVVILIIGGLGIFMNKGNVGPSKFDDFAKALKEKGAVFYGAFWCSHCQAQKAEFGSSKKYLPYVECSNPDNTQTQICKDEKIEGYPTWRFKDGIKITSSEDPLICDIKNKTTKELDVCVNRSSENYKTWIFSGYDFSVRSAIDPIKEGSVWKFNEKSEASGKMSLKELAEQINFTLPQ